MAGVIGRVGSFATVDPNTPNYIGNALSQTENQANLLRQEAAQKARQRKADFEKEKVDFKNFDYTLTGQKSLDDVGNSFATDTFNRYNEAVKKINDPTTPNEERQRLKIANSKRVQNFDTLKQIPTLLKAKADDLAKGIREGKYNERDIDLVKRKLEKLEKGQARVYTDDYGNMVYDIFDTDEKGQAIGFIEKSKPVSELITSMEPHAAPKFNTLLKSFTETTPLSEKAWQTGANKYEQKLVDDRVLAKVDAFADLIVADAGERYEIANALGVPENDPKVRQYAYDAARNSLAEKRKQDIDTAYLNYSETARHNRKTEEKDIVPAITSVTVAKNDQNIGGIEIPKGTKKLTYKGVIVGDPKKQYDEITDVTVRKKPSGGFDIIANVRNVGGESISVTEKKYTKSGQEKIDWNKKHPNEPQKDLYDFDIASETTTNKARPDKKLVFGQNDTELAQFASAKGQTIQQFTEEIIKSAGYDPNEQGKKETLAEKMRKAKNRK